MKSYTKDLNFLEISIEEIKDYLFSQQLYWPVGSGARLTLGSLLFSRIKLNSYPLSAELQKAFEDYSSKIDEIREKWRTNWNKKAKREYSARFVLWSNYMIDLLDDVGQHSFSYGHDVRWRVLLEILGREFQPHPIPELDRLAVFDQNLRSITSPGLFFWDDELSKSFPIENYWYLYVSFQKYLS